MAENAQVQLIGTTNKRTGNVATAHIVLANALEYGQSATTEGLRHVSELLLREIGEGGEIVQPTVERVD